MVDFKVLRDRPLFICGHPKSGTSLLRNLLDSHPALVVYPEETVFFRRFMPETAGKSFEQQIAAADDLLLHIFTWNRDNPPDSQAGFPDRDYSDIPFVTVQAHFHDLCRDDPPRHLGDVLAAAVLAYGKTAGGETTAPAWWVEKSPYNEFFTEQIFHWWPGARCIHIVRDPRDNYASYQRKHGSWTARFFATNWQRSTRRGLQNDNQYGPSRHRMIRYEDLVTRPAEILPQICDFLEIEMHPALEVPTRAGKAWSGNSMFAAQFSSIDSSPVGRWKKRLTPDEAHMISWITRQELQQLDYESGGRIPLGIRARGSYWAARQQLYLKWKGDGTPP